MLKYLFEYYSKNLELLPEEYFNMIKEKEEKEARAVCDYIAGMTDRYAVAKFNEIAIPRFWSVY